MIYFTSDTHFHHANVIGYCNRPFRDADEMNFEMTRRWNSKVRPEDTVYHLGDFAMGPADLLPDTRAGLNGRIILIIGNHDRKPQRMLDSGFDEVHKELTLELEGKKFYLHHQPMPFKRWADTHDFHLCGHVHEAWARMGNIINVGVDVSNFYPLTLQELLDRKFPLAD